MCPQEGGEVVRAGWRVLDFDGMLWVPGPVEQLVVGTLFAPRAALRLEMRYSLREESAVSAVCV